MRTTQYIGLNALAIEYTTTMNLQIQDKRHFTLGMFDEEVPLSMWMHSDGSIYKEIEQCSPWSSGPMIFTCLEDEDGNKLFQWLQDSDVRGREVDFENGRFWV
jgi:hypothetical protein